MAKNSKSGDNALAMNRKAGHDYIILEKYEAGIKLCGTEVKSCRAHDIAMTDSYVKIENGNALLLNVHIAPYKNGGMFNHDPKRPKQLLMHKQEILKLCQQIAQKGCTVVPLGFYLKGGLIKVSLGLCKGKTVGDKRETLREKQHDMDTKRAISDAARGRK